MESLCLKKRFERTREVREKRKQMYRAKEAVQQAVCPLTEQRALSHIAYSDLQTKIDFAWSPHTSQALCARAAR
jgi:hypothetical protein